MKLSILFVATTKAIETVEPVAQLNKIGNEIDMVWEQWYSACNGKRYKRLQKFIGKIEDRYVNGGCGTKGAPRPGRKRREDSENEDTEIVSKTDRDKAIDQIAGFIIRFASTHLGECTDAFSEKIENKAYNWLRKLKRRKCAVGVDWNKGAPQPGRK